jgi:uncharacterized membrane protein (DUF373 family)
MNLTFILVRIILKRNRKQSIIIYTESTQKSETIDIFFLSFVLPIFAWIYAIYPLLSEKQQRDLSHFYDTVL